MKTKSNKGLKGVTIFVSLLCVVSIVWILCQSYFVSTDSGEGCIEWHEDFYPVQLAIFAGRLIFKTAFYALIILFMIKQSKAIKNGTIFPNFTNLLIIKAMQGYKKRNNFSAREYCSNLHNGCLLLYWRVLQLQYGVGSNVMRFERCY